ncbi:uncharacterized protein LACBIDRAFT_335899 [Laccaria bicolor S238N-H82]|uniref:Predicted protein n=1 Tax=Laccaria bicolor (strain S238N-H82 / ATCC MYA-4686) TaxID=486041 RepID=B0E3S6_LACBS|nr:uncharacterized protein LACBIDRAFT_335899 [Laccaria bicolor S238N-H82]EDQ98507.1 predicted protein [Laccaria bicolor S238N-H82]|eukprot:XP_001890845.1 predicted protein [Laccaria bicolor S238N-H82]
MRRGQKSQYHDHNLGLQVVRSSIPIPAICWDWYDGKRETACLTGHLSTTYHREAIRMASSSPHSAILEEFITLEEDFEGSVSPRRTKRMITLNRVVKEATTTPEDVKKGFTKLILAFKLPAITDPEHSNLDLSQFVTRMRHSLNVFMTYMVKPSKEIIRDEGRLTGLLCFAPTFVSLEQKKHGLPSSRNPRYAADRLRWVPAVTHYITTNLDVGLLSSTDSPLHSKGIMETYFQPAAANYHTPPVHPQQRQRGYRICDQCRTPETQSLKFRLCGGCLVTQYCHTASVSKAAIAAASSSPAADEHLAKNLRKFASAHTALLGWAGFQALQLKRVPANIRQNALLIDLSYHPHAESHRRYSGGIGTLVVIIQCGGVSQVMPVEVDPPAKITWDSRDDWASVLAHFVESGRTDFKPISTTSRGVYYG